MGNEIQDTLPGISFEEINTSDFSEEPEDLIDNNQEEDSSDDIRPTIPPEMRHIIGPLYNIKEFSFIDIKDKNLEEEEAAKEALYQELLKRAKENKTKNFMPKEAFLNRTISQVNILVVKENDTDGKKVSIPYPFTYKTYREEEFTHYLFEAGKLKWEVIVKTNLLDLKKPFFSFSLFKQ